MNRITIESCGINKWTRSTVLSSQRTYPWNKKKPVMSNDSRRERTERKRNYLGESFAGDFGAQVFGAAEPLRETRTEEVGVDLMRRPVPVDERHDPADDLGHQDDDQETWREPHHRKRSSAKDNTPQRPSPRISRRTEDAAPHVRQLVEREIRRRFRRGGCLDQCGDYRTGEGQSRVRTTADVDGQSRRGRLRSAESQPETEEKTCQETRKGPLSASPRLVSWIWFRIESFLVETISF